MRRGLSVALRISAKVSVRFKPELWKAVALAMSKENYNLKQRSLWVSESIESIFKHWEQSSPQDIALDLRTYAPAVAHINPSKITLSATSVQRIQKLSMRFQEAAIPFDDLKTRLVYAAIVKRLNQNSIEYRSRESGSISTVETAQE